MTQAAGPRGIFAKTDAVVALLGGKHKLDRLGNKVEPLSELFFVMLSAQTPDGVYRSTHRAFRERFSP